MLGTVPEIWSVTDVIVIFQVFALLPPNRPKSQHFEITEKNTTGDIILHMCTKNYDQMMFSS